MTEPAVPLSLARGHLRPDRCRQWSRLGLVIRSPCGRSGASLRSPSRRATQIGSAALLAQNAPRFCTPSAPQPCAPNISAKLRWLHGFLVEKPGHSARHDGLQARMVSTVHSVEARTNQCSSLRFPPPKHCPLSLTYCRPLSRPLASLPGLKKHAMRAAVQAHRLTVFPRSLFQYPFADDHFSNLAARFVDLRRPREDCKSAAHQLPNWEMPSPKHPECHHP